MKIDYDELIEQGFSPQQINQILILEKFFDKDIDILNQLDENIDVDNIRILNAMLRKKEYSYAEKKLFLKLISQNINPSIYEIIDKNNYYNFEEIVSKKEKYDETNIDYYYVMKYIEKNPNNLSYLPELLELCIYKNIDPKFILVDGFSEEQLEFAFSLYDADLKELIPEINKTIFRCYDVMSDIKKMINLGMNYTAIINFYSDVEISTIIDAYEKGYDIHNVLKSIPYQEGNVKLCKKMMQIELDDNEIREILTKFEYSETQLHKNTWNKLIELEKEGYEIHKYFDTLPNINQMNILRQLIDIGYEDEDIYYYLEELGDNVKDVKVLLRMSVGDVEKYIELLDDGYNIKNIMENGWTYDNVNTLIKFATTKGIDAQILFNKQFEDFEFELINKCLNYGREDVVEALVECVYINEEIYDIIGEILENDERYNEFHDIVNLLYDSGCDTFCEFDLNYEFNVLQKLVLLKTIRDRKLNDEQIDIIRNNKIGAKSMSILCDILVEGYDIKPVMSKINILSDEDLLSIHSCMKLGFNLVLQEKNIER